MRFIHVHIPLDRLLDAWRFVLTLRGKVNWVGLMADKREGGSFGMNPIHVQSEYELRDYYHRMFVEQKDRWGRFEVVGPARIQFNPEDEEWAMLLHMKFGCGIHRSNSSWK